MKDKNFSITITVLLALVIVFLLILTINNNKEINHLKNSILSNNNSSSTIEKNEVNNNDINKNQKTSKEETNKDIKTSQKKENKKSSNNKSDSSPINYEENKESNIDNDITINSKETYSSKDLTIINETDNIHKSVKESINTENNENAKKICKGIFITYVDFIFFDGEINGIKFDELTDKGKETVLKQINKTDEYIDSKYPGYKSSITSTTKEAFNTASNLIKQGSQKISNFSKEKLGDDNYNSIIEAKDDLIEFTKSTSKVIKNVSINLYNKAKDKLYNWYINFKNK